VRKLKTTPDLLFVVDITRESTAIHEANVKGIPVIALVDTNCNPKGVDYIIPSNDDAIRAIKLLVGKIADAAIEGRGMRKDDEDAFAAAETEAIIRPTGSMARPMSIVEPELTDDDLLGSSTLAKLAPHEVEEALEA
jgi:small subunit ribosomal protein S2